MVLIDEIDKAPRDLPNDVLNEIEQMRFRIRETDWPAFEADQALRPVLILTSNSEKNLPDAFLRRCVFYHIPFPDRDALKQIVARRFSGESGVLPENSNRFVDIALGHFGDIRKLSLKKPPATAECIAWISILDALGTDLENPKDADKEKIMQSCSVLVKNRNDLERMKSHFAGLAKADRNPG